MLTLLRSQMPELPHCDTVRPAGVCAGVPVRRRSGQSIQRRNIKLRKTRQKIANSLFRLPEQYVRMRDFPTLQPMVLS